VSTHIRGELAEQDDGGGWETHLRTTRTHPMPEKTRTDRLVVGERATNVR